LANVPPQIATPRLRTPRTQVPRGSVAIADNQTAIYPQDSAGGWNIIGHTAFDNFDRFAIGDWVQFVRV
ncbi:MAG TPA: carboxyltransferase domain-containing protein, partial [Campylobacterales bacterium]|nr:carboxyltransferase domain-containing protein [Campylobacterales bacterium]